MSAREKELWEAAARCYVQAGQARDACRCLEQVGRYSEAAALHEAEDAWAEAARSHGRAGAHRAAARCYEAAGAWAEAARGHERAGDVVDAAWILADALGWHANALQVLGAREVGQGGLALGAELVRARCDAATGRAQRAADRLDAALGRAGEVTEAMRVRLRGWAVAVADALGRPDLGLRAHAVFGRGTEEDVQAWESWALRVLGESAPYPG